MRSLFKEPLVNVAGLVVQALKVFMAALMHPDLLEKQALQGSKESYEKSSKSLDAEPVCLHFLIYLLGHPSPQKDKKLVASMPSAARIRPCRLPSRAKAHSDSLSID